MKTQFLTIALSFLSVVAIAQKKEIRDAGKAVDKGNYSEARTLLNQAETSLSGANDRYKRDFYLYKGQAFLGNGENASVEDLVTAAEAFKTAQEMGSDDAAEGLAQVSNALVQGAINDQNAEQYESAADKLYAGYQLNKQDTVYLYYAASNAINAQNYERALEYYETLQNLGYTGEETQFIAVNKETGEEEAMSKEQRDLMVKTGQYIDPEDRTSPAKTGEIAKNIALIYISEGKEEEAIRAMEIAKKENPGDVTLLQSEADMYYRMGDKGKYKEIMEGIVEQDPNNPTLFYNLGVTAYEMGETEQAIEYYQKALELDPSMTDARLNIAAAILGEEPAIVDEMNSLGMSKADTQKYDELAEKRKELYREALPYLEQVLEKNPQNREAMQTAMNIHYQLGNTEQADALQEKLNGN